MSFSTALTDVFGERPQTARFKKLHPGEEQKQSLLSNIANFGDIAKLGEQYKNLITSQTESLLPGYTENLAKGEAGVGKLLDTGNTLLSGELPQDVKDQVMRSSAYGALSGGFAGSGMAHALTARDLGRTSLDLMQQGADMIGRGNNSAQLWSNIARGDTMNPASQFISPEFQANYDLQNQVLKQQSKQFQYNVAAAPSPGAAGISNTIMGLLGMYLGGGMGGGMGGKGGGGLAQAGQTSVPVNAGQNYNMPQSYSSTYNYDPYAFNDVSLFGGFGG